MNLTVRSRITIAMSLVVVANLLTSAVSTIYFKRAEDYQRLASAATQHAATASVASVKLTDFLVELEGYVVAQRSNRPVDQTDAYGRLVRADQAARQALTDVEHAYPGDVARKVASEWQLVRLGGLIWVNGESGEASASVRLWLTPGGDINTSSASNVPVPSYLTNLSHADVRPAVRTKFDMLRDATIAQAAESAENQATNAAEAEQAARELANTLTLGLGLLSLLAAIAAGVWVYRGTVLPLQEARDFADRVAAGDLDASYAKHRADEIGHLTEAIENMKDAVVRDLRAMQEMAGAVLVTADGVNVAAKAAQSAYSSATGSADDEVASSIASVAAQAETLEGLAKDMLGA